MKNASNFHNERGLTLAEVLVSIVLLGIIITSAMLMLTQTAKTNKVSEDIIDATYIAQTEIETIYHQKGLQGYSGSEHGEDEWTIYRWKDDPSGSDLKIETSTKLEKEGDMIRIVVRVYENKSDADTDAKPQAQMENFFETEDWNL